MMATMSNHDQTAGWIISVDGGGTSTEVVLADIHGGLIGEGHSGPSNAKAVGVPAAMKAADDGIRAAFESRWAGTSASGCGEPGPGRI